MNIAVQRDQATGNFFDAAGRGEFLLVRDRQTGEVLGPQTNIGVDSHRYETFPGSGCGTVVSWSVVHERGHDGTPVRTVVAVVELQEGPWWWTELVEVDPEAELIGVPVEVVFTKSGPGESDEYVPRFRPLTAPEDRP